MNDPYGHKVRTPLGENGVEDKTMRSIHFQKQFHTLLRSEGRMGQKFD